MRLDLKRGVFIAAIVFAMTGIAELVARQQVNPDAQILADFTERVKAYVALRDKVDGDAPKLQETKDAAKIKAAQLALAALIRSARSTAKQGEIFTPPIEKKFRALLRPEVKGPEGAKTKATILDEKPAVALKVNADYPSTEPLATVPPGVLQALPPLPEGEGLEYRFVRTHMILLDTRANLIVDFLLNAIP
jgi:hypothetical protein